jgi:PAS domain S-box-containing protein
MGLTAMFPPRLVEPHPVVRLLLAIGMVAVATVLRLAADPLLHDQVPFFIYVGAVVFATWFAGVAGGVVATVVATFAGNYFFVPPRLRLSFTTADTAAMALFAALSLVLVWTIGRWRHAETRARQRAEELSAILDTVPAAVFIAHDPDANIITGNRAASELLCLPHGANLSKTAPRGARPETFRIVSNGSEVPGSELPVQQAARGIEIRDMELDVVYPDGTSRTIFGNARPVRDGGSDPRGAVAAFVDVTERRRLDNELRRQMEELEGHVRDLAASEARYRIMGETLPYGVWLAGPDGGARYVSDSFLELLNMTQEEQRQFGWTQRLVPEDVEPMLAKWLHCVRTGEMWDSEHRIVDRNGEIRTVLTRGLPVRDPDGTITSWVGVNLDITLRKRLEGQLKEQAEQLAQANRMKDEFLGVLSHELRTPLNAILGWSEMLLHHGLDPGTTRKAIEAINRNARAQSALINDVLDVSRIVSGKLRLDVRPIDVSAVVQAALDTIRPAADAKQILIETLLDPGAMLIGDPERLQQVVWNLLSNSVKFTPAGGRIEVTARHADFHVEIRVRDNGLGIPSEFLPHVFERFRQRDSSTTRPHQTGLGLGLAIVRHLVELHGGTVRAESAGDLRGAEFVVMLPVRAVFEPQTETERTAEQLALRDDPPARPDALAGVRVLVVDDQADARALLDSALRHAGADVIACASGSEALAVVEQERVTVLVADIGMPGMDGYELIRRLLARPESGPLPALALTAFGAPEDRRKALEAGYREHLAKPVVPDHLIAVVATLART